MRGTAEKGARSPLFLCVWRSLLRRGEGDRATKSPAHWRGCRDCVGALERDFLVLSDFLIADWRGGRCEC